MESFELHPEGPLFFRDARPLDRDKSQEDYRNIGHGAQWPRPDHLYNGVMHALIGSRGCSERARYGEFGGVRTTGPFPMRDGAPYFPRPLDWDMGLERCEDTDLPAFLTHGLIDRTEGKKQYPAYISREAYRGYLGGHLPGELDKEGDAGLFRAEPRACTTLDRATGASKRVEGKRSGQYCAEYLRLGRGVSMACRIETGAEGTRPPARFILGGRNGIVEAVPSGWDPAEDFPAPEPPSGGGAGPILLRWTLLSPAVFSQTGWLPGWCKDSRKEPPEGGRRPDGEVMFPGCEGIRLIAARVGKALFFSGWDTLDGPKPTVLAVPAGSAYFFECPDAGRARALTARLHLQRKSDFGSQGFGIGVCSFVSVTR